MKKLVLRLLTAFAVLLLIAWALLALQLDVPFLRKPAHLRIIGDLPASARLVQFKGIHYGVDTTYLYEFSCSDSALRDALVNKWRLRDLTESSEEPRVTKFNRPHWWPSEMESMATREFGRIDNEEEIYWSVWECSETSRLYVTVGQW